MPSNTVDLSAFQGFLAEAAVDERFSADRFLSEIDARGIEIDTVNRLALKFVGIGMVRERLLAIVDRFDEFVHNEPTFGPGRFDTFNPAKALLNWEFDADPRGRAHRGGRLPLGLHAGAEGGDAAALGRQQHQGLRAQPLRRLRHRRDAADPRPRLARAHGGLAARAEPPRFADVFPAQFDAALAAEGAPVYARECAACHGASGRDFSGAYVGKVTPIGEVGTDRGRLDNYTHDLAVSQNVLYAEFGSERFQTFRKTGGYANAPLDGLWLRAPYLHNGSVPTLAALLSPPEERPGAFLRGYDVYDPQAVGFESDPARIDPAVQARLFCYVTRADAAALCPAEVPPMNGTCDAGACRGNGNGGHLWGTELPPAEKRALIEHLKTF